VKDLFHDFAGILAQAGAARQDDFSATPAIRRFVLWGVSEAMPRGAPLASACGWPAARSAGEWLAIVARLHLPQGGRRGKQPAQVQRHIADLQLQSALDQ